MGDAIIWLAAIGIVIALFWSLVREQGKRKTMTDEEYHQRAADQPSLISRGMMELDQIVFRPQARAAIEYQRDRMQGQTGDQESAGEKLDDESDDAIETGEAPEAPATIEAETHEE